VRRLLVLLALGASALAAGAAPAGATSECNGLPACVRVPGPWVVVPAPAPPASRQRVEYQLTCPQHFVVGGLDAQLSARTIEISFLGILGGPVNPGITTSSSAVFVAAPTGSGGTLASFRPLIGCMPAGRGAGSPPTLFRAPRAFAATPLATGPSFAPGQPSVRRVKQFELGPSSSRRLTLSCARGERLLQGSRAVGFYSNGPPDDTLMQAVSTTLAVDASRVTVVARTGAAVARTRAVVQLQAVCAGTS
jgi:hypothetical protein